METVNWNYGDWIDAADRKTTTSISTMNVTAELTVPSDYDGLALKMG